MKEMNLFNESSNDLKKFVRSNYVKVLNMCRETYSDFPECCDRVSYIFEAYLSKIFPKEVIKICSGAYNKAYHVWLCVNNDYIIDITRFQFTEENYNYFNPIIEMEYVEWLNYVCLKYLESNQELMDMAIKSNSIGEYLARAKTWRPKWIKDFMYVENKQ